MYLFINYYLNLMPQIKCRLWIQIGRVNKFSLVNCTGFYECLHLFCLYFRCTTRIIVVNNRSLPTIINVHGHFCWPVDNRSFLRTLPSANALLLSVRAYSYVYHYKKSILRKWKTFKNLIISQTWWTYTNIVSTYIKKCSLEIL